MNKYAFPVQFSASLLCEHAHYKTQYNLNDFGVPLKQLYLAL